MRSRIDNAKILLVPFLLLILAGCNECNDCGPSRNYPFVKVRFYNIDSLQKVEQNINVLLDSLDSLNILIAGGEEEYIATRDQVQDNVALLQTVSFNIESGKIRIEEISGPGADKILYFRDSLARDSLTIFNFPLRMDEGRSDYYIRLKNRIDTLSVRYDLESGLTGQSILVRAYGIHINYFTYDSLNITCSSETCLSDVTTISVYF